MRKTRRTNGRLAINEKAVRKIVNEEMRRRALIEAGLLDTIKGVFGGLSDKLKKKVSSKAADAAKKLSKAIEELKNKAPLEQVNKFLEEFKKQKQRREPRLART